MVTGRAALTVRPVAAWLSQEASSSQRADGFRIGDTHATRKEELLVIELSLLLRGG
jgi:hypothetical protein